MSTDQASDRVFSSLCREARDKILRRQVPIFEDDLSIGSAAQMFRPHTAQEERLVVGVNGDRLATGGLLSISALR
jgi:hypothetical protein